MVIPVTEEHLKLLHQIVLENDPKALSGYMYEGMIDGSMKRALVKVYGYEPFKDIVDKAAALMYSIIVFHPFNDGNKRTALLAVYFFLSFNRYYFEISRDAVNVTIAIADKKIKNEKIISNWLRQYTGKSLFARLQRFVILSTMKEGPMDSIKTRFAMLSLPLLNFMHKIWPKKHTGKT